MTSILFVTWAGGGNSTPVLGLATRLAARGHRVKVAGPDDAGARFAAVGVDYERFGWAEGEVLGVVQREQPDVVVVDFMMPTWMNQVEATGRSWIALVHTLYDRVAAGILTAFTSLEKINVERLALGLAELEQPADLLRGAARCLVTAPRELEAPGAVPDNVQWVGAILEEPGADAEWEPPAGDGPLVAVSLGTTPGLDDLLATEAVLDAAAVLPMRFIVNAGAHIDVDALRPPPNVTVSGYVRHAAVLPHADATVNHAGLGSIVASLAYGLPMVCVPLDRDQPHNAERVGALGLGVVVAKDAPGATYARAIEWALSDRAIVDAVAPFAATYDPTASAAIAAIERLV